MNELFNKSFISHILIMFNEFKELSPAGISYFSVGRNIPLTRNDNVIIRNHTTLDIINLYKNGDILDENKQELLTVTLDAMSTICNNLSGHNPEHLNLYTTINKDVKTTYGKIYGFPYISLGTTWKIELGVDFCDFFFRDVESFRCCLGQTSFLEKDLDKMLAAEAFSLI